MSDTKKQENNEKEQTMPYTMQDALKVADDIFKLNKENNYHLGAFVHGLIFALEYSQFSYDIPQQQIAIIRRDCRKYIQEATRQRTPGDKK